MLTAPEVHLDIGSRATIPAIPGLVDVPYLTETELLAATECPRHLVVVGGGYIGLELGQAYRRLGAEVTMLVGGGVATREDPDVAAILTDVLTADGVRIVTERPSAVTRSTDGGIEVSVHGQEPIRGTHLLLATGRRSNVDLLGDRHGLAVDDRGFLTIGPRYETSAPGIWALGDVNGHGAFTHTAYQDSQIVLDPNRTVTGRVSTYAMFTDPPLGRVGMSLSEARASGRRVLMAEVPMSRVTRAVLEGETIGVMRLLADADTEELLGATILGLQADDVVQIISLAMQTGTRYPAVRDMLPIHPTMAEFLPSLLGALQPLD
jgi:pyruvate/2-oxoglutarate dehydrogenase complex dihydrolipoamide dehydrogenase (E3) component